MAFDGIVVAALVRELSDCLTDGRIYKIAQPEKDELQLTVRKEKSQYMVLISAGAGLPLVYLTEEKKTAPLTAPNFCMLLRKHIQNGRVVSVTQPGLERVIDFEIEHRDELGDLCHRHLRVEIMGKHSNVIFCDDKDIIIDSIRHVSAQVSSVREVLPGRTYFIPETMEKLSPLSVGFEDFRDVLEKKPMPLAKALYTSFTGLSPVMAEEIACRASLDSAKPFSVLNEAERTHLFGCFRRMMDDISRGEFTPCIIYEEDADNAGRFLSVASDRSGHDMDADRSASAGRAEDAAAAGGGMQTPVEFAALLLQQYRDYRTVRYDSMSEVLETYYGEKNTVSRIRQRSADLRKIVQTALERNVRKYDLQTKQLKDTEKKEKYRIFGELLHTYGTMAEPGAKSLEAENYYTGEMITIPLDPQKTASENAKKYFDRYGKLKRTEEALTGLIKETGAEIAHLESVSSSLDIARSEEDLAQIREELVISGYIRRKANARKQKITSKPFHYLSSDGYDIYVGKNNLQNDKLTFQTASGNDWWFHAKGMPGSHVVLMAKGTMPPDRTFEEAASLAAHYSKGGKSGQTEVDYVEKKHVKKPNGSKPGFVVYYTNYSMMAKTDISGIKQIE